MLFFVYVFFLYSFTQNMCVTMIYLDYQLNLLYLNQPDLHFTLWHGLYFLPFYLLTINMQNWVKIIFLTVISIISTLPLIDHNQHLAYSQLAWCVEVVNFNRMSVFSQFSGGRLCLISVLLSDNYRPIMIHTKVHAIHTSYLLILTFSVRWSIRSWFNVKQ